MDSLNVEKAKKIIIPLFITVGGLWLSYATYVVVPYFYGFVKFQRYNPSQELLQKAWEGFEYDPQNDTLQQVVQVLQRSSFLCKELFVEFTHLMKRYRRQDKPDDFQEFITAVKIEIDYKFGMAQICLMKFLQFKNHSFEQFYQKYFLEQNQGEVMQIIMEYEIDLFISYDLYKQKLLTINQCIDNLKDVKKLIQEKKPQVDRLRIMVAQNGQERFRFLYVITYLSDVFQLKLNLEFQNLVTALKFINFEKIPSGKKDQAKSLMDEYKQICATVFD